MSQDCESSETAAARLAAVRGRIAETCRRCGRDPASVQLVAVSKRRSIEAAQELHASGQVDFGENYPQELWKKAEILKNDNLRWHLIGHLQSNKLTKTYSVVHMIHAVDSLKLLRQLDEHAARLGNPPRVCLQVNCSGEVSKHGWSAASILADAPSIAACAHIPIVGLMTMAALADNPEQARPAFRELRNTRDQLRGLTGLPLPELSMGMSNDYTVAIEEGATWVRIGTALFEGGTKACLM